VENDDELLREALAVLEYVGCQFWDCTGPTLTPEDMRTCNRCSLLARLRQRFGREVCHVEETPLYTEAVRIRRVARDAHREVSLDEALVLAAGQEG
jgi:hypothetical protein